MTESKDAQMENLEEEVFRALDHQKRRDILRFVGEGTTFTEVLNSTGIPDSPSLSYHLRSPAPFMEQR